MRSALGFSSNENEIDLESLRARLQKMPADELSDLGGRHNVCVADGPT